MVLGPEKNVVTAFLEVLHYLEARVFWALMLGVVAGCYLIANLAFEVRGSCRAPKFKLMK